MSESLGPVAPPTRAALLAFDPYNVPWRGGKLDPYRVVELYRIESMPIAQAIKKLLRCGAKHKSMEADVAEAISSLVRWQEMRAEDKAWLEMETVEQSP